MTDGKKDTNPKDAVGSRKPTLATVPCAPLYEAAAALQDGALKYRRHNWRVSGVRKSVYYDACLRHLMRWWEGEDQDPDSGMHHLAHAIAGLLIIRDAEMQGMAVDDRPPGINPGWIKLAAENTERVIAKHQNPLPPYTRENLEE